MAKTNKAETSMGSFGPDESQSASGAYPDPGPSRDAKDYVLIERVSPEGLRYEEQVLKTEADGEGRHAHPPENRPTSDLTEEEAKALGRER